jgi:hypothetical protein
MLPSLVRLSVNRTAVSAESVPLEIWRNILASVINDDVRKGAEAYPESSRDIIRMRAESLDNRFSRLCEINQEFRDICAVPSIWRAIVQKERDVIINKLNELQAQQATRTLPLSTFCPINDFVQLFLYKTGFDLNAISPTLGRLEAMRILVLLFGAPQWMIEFMWVYKGEEDERHEEGFEFQYIDDNELGPEGGGYPSED